MDRHFWEDRWSTGQIGFHEGKPNRFVARFADRLPTGAVFVPLCGKSVDLDFLAARGNRVTGCELVERAVCEYFEERGGVPSPRRVGAVEVYDGAKVRIVRGDVLAYEPEARFDAIYDRAALIALPVEVRRVYAARMTSMLAPSGRMLLVSLEHDAGSGPPFDVPAAEVDALYGGAFAIEALDREDVLAENPRMAEKGATRVHECAYLLTPRGDA